ncbi:hypothetical protein BpHYR1_050676 [Brachionus plicatilis]|uniref:Uncharacterized protein n=1 Tax=Brachionus plicatilis TaxID=10195 RepID=A0A3M7SLH8_BRAPC|nr:hypothetical protein BpHYR1_050676 [Brachionus plicatilis]
MYFRVLSHYVQRATIGDLSCRPPPQASLAVQKTMRIFVQFVFEFHNTNKVKAKVFFFLILNGTFLGSYLVGRYNSYLERQKIMDIKGGNNIKLERCYKRRIRENNV